MEISEGLEKLVQKKYEEAKKLGVTSILIEERIGGMKLYVNHKPKFSLASFEAGADKLYVGAETMTETPSA